MDTAHAFAYGYNLANKRGLDKTLSEFDKIIGLEKLKLMHLNDSKSSCGSHLDRHENIGEGHMGLLAFKNIVNHPKIKHLPAILETPGFKEKSVDKRNLDIVKKLVVN